MSATAAFSNPELQLVLIHDMPLKDPCTCCRRPVRRRFQVRYADGSRGLICRQCFHDQSKGRNLPPQVAEEANDW